MAACPENFAPLNKVCACSTGFYQEGQSCKPCHDQCFGGCTGPLPSQCQSCKLFRHGSNCVNECPVFHSADQNNVCGRCSDACADSCTAPADPTQCRSCLKYRDDDRCVLECPQAKQFVDGSRCMSQCPSSRPYYNDTRLHASTSLELPQRCVASCSALNDQTKLNVAASAPYRCSTAERIAFDNPAASTSGDNQASIVIGSVAAAAVIVVIAAIFIYLRTNRGGNKVDITPQPGDISLFDETTASRAKVNSMYFPSRASTHYFDPHSQDLRSPSQYEASFVSHKDDSYMQLSPTMNKNPYEMHDDALFHADDFDYALQVGSRGSMQTTQM